MSNQIAGLGLLTKGIVESLLDGRVYHGPTNPMPVGGIVGGIVGSVVGGVVGDSNKVEIGNTKYFPSKQSSDLIKINVETKKVKQHIATKPDIKISHVPSKYARTYELEKFKGNRMLIFNHSEFRDSSRRPGTELDQKALIETFIKFGFEVESHSNLSKRELMNTLRNFAQADFTEYGCMCVAVMTHGHEKPGYLEAYDQHYNEHDLFYAFDSLKNPTLAAKPIIFIIQACRGAKASTKVYPDRRMASQYQLDLDDDDYEVYHLPTEADRIVFHSSVVGKASIRHPLFGSWFIQTLCATIQEHGYKEDLETIFRLVRRTVALDFVNSRDWKQMPVVTSTLLRVLYLVPSDQISPSKDIMDIPCKDPEIHIQLINKLKEPWPKTPDESPDLSLTPVQPIHMPCSCFLEYFEYLKKCLEFFVQHNPEDTVAKNLAKMTRRVGDGAEYNVQKFSFIQSVWEHFDANMDKFPLESSKFVYRKYI